MGDLNCPHCREAIELNLAAVVPPEQTFTLVVSKSAQMMAAKSVAGLIGETEKLMRSVARDVGAKVNVFVMNIEWTDDKFAVEFVITDVSRKKAEQMSSALSKLCDTLESQEAPHTPQEAK